MIDTEALAAKMKEMTEETTEMTAIAMTETTETIVVTGKEIIETTEESEMTEEITETIVIVMTETIEGMEKTSVTQEIAAETTDTEMRETAEITEKDTTLARVIVMTVVIAMILDLNQDTSNPLDLSMVKLHQVLSF